MTSIATNEAILITNSGIGSLSSALAFFSKDLDRIIPWNTYRETWKELDRYRDDYSNESGQLVNEIKGLMSDAQSNYHSATQAIYEWCSIAIQLLNKYRDLFNQRSGDTYSIQRALLIQVLEIGSKKMANGQDKLLQSSMSFNNASGKLTTLHSRFTNEFDSKSSYYQSKVDQIRKEAYAGAASGIIGGPLGLLIAYSIAAGTVEGKLIPELNEKLRQTKTFFDNLKTLIDKSDRDIYGTKAKLQDEYRNIVTFKVKAEETKTMVPLDELDALRDNVLESVNNLIAQCDEYQRYHGRKN